jgi:hypothetical protein
MLERREESALRPDEVAVEVYPCTFTGKTKALCSYANLHA